ncbi:MAG: hypothetical protein EBR82_35400 [Caulobacteraceae bacterium]|nr:hypothetical protein [Caulobacteraceae bacterium]
MAGEDQSVMAATAKILALGPDVLGLEAPKRENRIERDPIEREQSTDMDVQDEGAKEAQTPAPEQKEAAADEAGDFLEIPGEGEEVEKVPLAEAVEAVKQYRAMRGDIAAAVNRAEIEYSQRMDAQVQAIATTYAEVARQAQIALEAMPRPRPPSDLLRDQRSEYYNPEEYVAQLEQYQAQLQQWQAVEANATAAQQQEQRALEAAALMRSQREHERVARFIPEWGKDETRALVQDRLYKFLETEYGVDAALLDTLPFDHRFVRAMNDLATLKAAKTQAPEVRKAVQEKAPKITRGGQTPQRAENGQFVSAARQQLSQSGSETDAARLFLTDPRFKSLFT